MIIDNLRAVEAAGRVARDPTIHDSAIRRYRARCAYISEAFAEVLRIRARDQHCEAGLVRRTSVNVYPERMVEVRYLGRNNQLVEQQFEAQSLQQVVDKLNQYTLKPLGITPIYYSVIQREVDKVLDQIIEPAKGGRG